MDDEFKIRFDNGRAALKERAEPGRRSTHMSNEAEKCNETLRVADDQSDGIATARFAMIRKKMADELNVQQTCPKCGSVQSVSPSYAEYIHRYGCYECRQRDVEKADAASPIRTVEE